MATITGGQGLKDALQKIADHIGRPGTVRVGFLENATYPDGTPVAMIAAIQNYGAPKVGIPPRPFFSNMIKDKSPTWPAAVAALVKARNTTDRVLNLMGEGIKGQLQQSIRDFVGVPLAPSTVVKKGHDKQLINTAHMLNSVNFEVNVG